MSNKKTPFSLRVYSEFEIGRKDMMKFLKVGESIVFICEPGQTPGKLQALLASNFRGDESMGKEGLEQKRGLIVFEGEPAVYVTRVTRISEPQEKV